MAFPAAVSGSVTLWVYRVDKETSTACLIRIPLKNCYWNENSIRVFERTGEQVKNSVKLYIPFDERATGKRYVTPQEWNSMPVSELGGVWAVDLTQPLPPVAVKGDSNHLFDWGTGADVARAHNAFLSANPAARVIRDVNPMLIGSEHLQHIVLRGS